MAHWLRWAAGTTVALLVTVVLVHRAAILMPGAGARGTDGTQRLQEAGAELRRLEQEVSLLGRAHALMPPPGADSGPVHLALPRNLDAESATLLAERVREELADVGEPGARVVLLMVDPRVGREGRGDAGSPPSEIYAGRDEQGDYCAVVLLTAYVRVDSTFRYRYRNDRREWWPGGYVQHDRASLLGVCRLWARYGPPGAGVAAWLERGGSSLAEALPIAGVTPPPLRMSGVGSLLGSSFTLSHESPDVRRCIAGNGDACVTAFMADGRRTSLPPAPGGVRIMSRAIYGQRHFGTRDQTLLAEMEEALGPERFAAFWRSDADVPAAYQAAAGAPLGPWLAGWAQHRFGRVEVGAAPNTSTTLLSLLFLAAMVGIALLVVQRRQA
jgi:hypothetical protein